MVNSLVKYIAEFEISLHQQNLVLISRDYSFRAVGAVVLDAAAHIDPLNCRDLRFLNTLKTIGKGTNILRIEPMRNPLWLERNKSLVRVVDSHTPVFCSDN